MTETAILLTFYDAEELQQLQLLDLLRLRGRAAKAALNARRGYEKAARELQIKIVRSCADNLTKNFKFFHEKV